ncbi:MAG: AAA family ATPase [Acidobacteriota bacterium]|nr:AAA family ATPase [Acidobacteriota bacterium]
MIVTFRVANFRSILEEQVLDFAAGTAKTIENPDYVFMTPEPKPQRLLKSLVLYGPNASGKSNLLSALRFMLRFIRDSHKLAENEPTGMEPFAFSNQAEPGLFELTFFAPVEGKPLRLQYGFLVDENRVREEWLYAYPTARGQTWLHRHPDEEKVWIGRAVRTKTYRTVAEERTNDNTLFLSKAGATEKHPLLAPIYQWLRENVLFLDLGRTDPFQIRLYAMNKLKQDTAYSEFVNDLMVSSDTGILKLKLEELPLAEALSQADNLPEELQSQFLDELKKKAHGSLVTPVLKAYHPNSDGEGMIAFDFNRESLGTRRLFTLSGPLHQAIQQGAVLVVDELESSLHPNLVRHLLAIFHRESKQENPAQLLFSTHQTHLLDKRYLRRDQIWLTQKDKRGATRVYSLWEFKVRNDEALEKGYLIGRYGGVPILNEAV